MIDALGEQLDAPAPAGDGELLTARTAERFRAEIRACFGFRETTVADADALIVWLRDHAAPEAAGALDVLVVRVIGELFALGDARGWRMNDFKGRHFEGEIVLWAVRW